MIFEECDAASIGIEATFPDEIFRNYVSANCDSNKDGSLSSSEIANVTTMSITALGINNLQGIKSFTSLEQLDCMGNNLTSLDVSGMTSLSTLNCVANNLTSLNVTGCTSSAVIRRYFGGNRNELLIIKRYTKPLGKSFTDIVSARTILSCNGNNLTSLNIANCSMLVKLDCSNNSLTSLNLDSATNLEQLWCKENNITELDLSNCSSLKSLICSYNPITTLNVENCTNLEVIYCAIHYSINISSEGVTVNRQTSCIQTLDVTDCSCSYE